MIRFETLKEEHLEQVLEWRTKEDVTRFMNTDVEKNMDKQRDWFKSVSDSNTDKYWVISIKDTLVGLIYLNGIDFVNKRTSWGFYIGEEKYRMYGAIIPLHLYNYVFTKLGFHKITAEVMSKNENVIKLNKVHGYRKVGVYHEHIYKNDEYHDLVLMELLKKEYEKNDQAKRYASHFED